MSHDTNRTTDRADARHPADRVRLPRITTGWPGPRRRDPLDHRAGARAEARDRRHAEHQSPPPRAEFRPSARRDRAADLQLADGWPIVTASRILGHPLPARVAGIDMVERLVDGDKASRSRYSVAVRCGLSPRPSACAGGIRWCWSMSCAPDEIATNRVRGWPSELSRPPRIYAGRNRAPAAGDSGP